MMVMVRVQYCGVNDEFLDSKSDPVIFLATRDPAGVATFWRPATRATPRPCQPWHRRGFGAGAAHPCGRIPTVEPIHDRRNADALL